MRRSTWPLLDGRTRPLQLKEWGDLAVMDPEAGRPPRGRGFLAAEKDWLHIDAGSALENPIVTLYAGQDPGAEDGWDEVEEITVVSTTGFLALCDSGYEPLRKENLATAGAGPYLVRVHADDRSVDDKRPRFLIQVIPVVRTGAEPEPPSDMIEEAAGPLLVRTSFERPEQWARLLQAVEEGPERHEPIESITIVDNRAYSGFTPEQILARIGRDGEDWPDSTLVLVADERALGSAELPLLAVSNVPDEDDAPFRIALAAAGSFVDNMELANTDFAEWAAGVEADGAYREEHY
ncbi:DUF6924 domain-containing protein [Streptomyces neyagawaensis]|uniref:DUF6924 domain-containing protein n=1 Tax=Streptomyces neyagawaensis TaxID=42238 RepID=UPI0006E378D5|nr:hypothetical protein [Streptomyces neyagawaensis]MCL6732690.1 hypothetical protein [Streptomyces neyagawaensis]MDE1681540.1 hypothetical protein [Streptomyces neyagawaensis]